jgi:TonB family protein
MNTARGKTIESLISQQFYEVLANAKTGNFHEALVSIRKAKTSYPRNIYVIAAEKQLERLVELAKRNMLTEEQRTEIMNSLPGLAERAINDEEKREHLPAPPPRPAPRPPIDNSAKEAALEKLKMQYLQHAKDFETKGNFAQAMIEVRRIYIIDPENQIASEYEQRLQRLIAQLSRDNVRQQTPEVDSPMDTPGLTVLPTAISSESAPRLNLVSTRVDMKGHGAEPPVEETDMPAPFPLGPAEQTTVQPERLYDGTQEAAVIVEPSEVVHEVSEPSRSKALWLTVGGVILAVGVTAYVLFVPAKQEQFTSFQNQTTSITPATTQPQGGEPATEQKVVPETRTDARKETPTSNKTLESKSSASTRLNGGTSKSDDLKENTPSKQNQGEQAAKETSPPASDIVALPPKKSTPTAENVEPPGTILPAPRPIDNEGGTAQQLIESKEQPAANTRSEEKSAVESAITIVQEAQIVKLAKPTPPRMAKEAGFEGQVTVSALIDKEGKPTQVKVLKSTNEIFNDAAIEAVMNSRFSPRITSAGPAETWVSVPFSFRR